MPLASSKNRNVSSDDNRKTIPKSMVETKPRTAIPKSSSATATTATTTNDRRRLSLPSTVPSSTVITKSKVERRRSILRNKENITTSVPPSKRMADDGRSSHHHPDIPSTDYSPPLTRSNSKNKKPRLSVNPSFFDESNLQNALLQFSPPNQKQNVVNEQERILQYEQQRSRRIAELRRNGQFLLAPATMTTSDSLPEGGDESACVTTSNVSNNVKPDELLLKMSADVSRLAQIQLEADRNRRTSEAELIQKVHEIMTTQKDSESLQRRQSTEQSTTQTLLQLEQSKSEQLIQELKELNRKVSSEQESYQVHVTKLEMQLQQINEKNLASEQIRTSVENEKVELQNLISQLQSRTETLENEIQAEREQLHQKETYIQELKRQDDSKNEHLSQQNSQLQYMHSETQEKYDHMVRSYETLETTMKSKEDELRRYECDIVPTLEATIEMERDTIARMEEAYSSQRQNEIEEYQEEKSKLVEQLQRVRDESDREKMKYGNCHQEYTEIREEYESYKTEKDTLVKTLQQQMNDEIHKLTNLNAELQMTNHTFVEQQKQINDALEESIAQNELCDKEKGALTTQLQQTLQQYDDMKEMITNKDSEVSVQVQQLNDQLVKEREHAKQLQMESDRKVHHQNQEITLLQQQVKQINQERDEARSNMLGYNEREHKLYQQLLYYENVRRTLHSKLIQFMGNIRVYVRVRPTLENETMEQNQIASNNNDTTILSNRSNSTKRKLNDHDEEPIFHFPGMYNCSNDSSIPLMDDESSTSKDMQQRRTSKRPATSTTNSGSSSTDLTKNIIEVVAPYKDRGGLNDRRSKWKFGFDHVFTPKHTQQDVWEATDPLIQCGVDGYNVTIFAYGQTGSGKTFTMLGEDGINEGIIGRTVRKLFDEKQKIMNISRDSTGITIFVELLEIYNEKVFDLMSSGREELKVTSNEVVGNTLVETNSVDEVMQILKLAQSRRCVKATNSNIVSSRSHMIFTIHFKVIMQDGITIRNGKVNICDLAGSERLNKSGANTVGGALLEETKNINKSLSVLSNVIERLQAGDTKNVPYRESKLTFLLKDSLSGNSKTLAIVCCNPLVSHINESLCSLRFAEKVNRVDLKAVTNFTS